ncbi:MAG TPA: HAD-IB family hydrolase [Petrotogaceae bacterium]|nr:HAD-IB family hydrolase [Petrotogaceae bacterium]
MKKYAAFFDLDKTLLVTNSGNLFFRYCYRLDQIKFWELIKLIPYPLLYKLDMLNVEALARKLVLRFKGASKEEIYEFTGMWVKNMVKDYFRKSAVQELNLHKEKGAHTVMISASTHNLCYPIQKYLGIEELICTDIKFENNIFTGDLGVHCYAQEKLTRAENFCKNHGYSLEDAYFYSDSYSDLHLLEEVGHPVCVDPDMILKKTAKEKKWPILY